MIANGRMAASVRNAAFGDDPGRWPLPAARRRRTNCGCARWSPAGRAATAARWPTWPRVRRLRARGPLASLAHSTRASFLRQLGWHDRARALGRPGDGAGRVGPGGRRRRPHRAGRRRARRRAGSPRRRRRCGAPASCSTDRRRRGCRCGWRGCRRSWRWPRGDGATAVGHAERAVELAAAFGSARHAVKSDVVLAAALCSAGDIDASRRVADAALAGHRTARHDPAALGVGMPARPTSAAPVTPRQRSLRIRDECADTVRRRGGVWADR